MILCDIGKSHLSSLNITCYFNKQSVQENQSEKKPLVQIVKRNNKIHKPHSEV